MFDIGWSEMMVVAMLALIIIGPKDLPRVMRSVAHWVRKAQSLAREFQSGLDEMAREADLEDAKKMVDIGRGLNVRKIVEDTVDPTGSVRKEAEDLRSTVKTKPAAAPLADKSKAEESKTEESKAKESKTDAAATPEPESPARETAAAAGDGANAPKATIIEHPVQVAPPHSITPPAEPEGAAGAAAKGDEDNSQKTA